MKRAIVFEAPRTGYSIDQVKAPMTVGQLREFLEEFDDDTLIITSHDRGYTYGTIGTGYSGDYEIHVQNEDGEWEEEWV